MDFFAQQDRARTSSTTLVVMFALAVIAVLVLVNLAAIVCFGFIEANAPAPSPEMARRGGIVGVDWLQWDIILTASAITLAIIVGGSLYKLGQLRQGGARIAQQLGGTEVPANPQDPGLRQLRNVVEEMSLASGLSVPALYVLENEPGINAFAAGWDTDDAAIAVTRGTLDALDRDELQGVIAHEFSHVRNGDMRLNANLIGWVFGLLVLSILGRVMLYSGAGSRNRGANVGFGLVLIVVGGIGVLAGRLIQAAVSRQRELLADASAVQFTRYPEGLAGALKKIARHSMGSRLASPKTQEVSHMLFGPGLASRLFATHPPLVERIRAIQPQFDPAELEGAPATGTRGERAAGAQPGAVAGFASGGTRQRTGAATGDSESIAVSPKRVTEQAAGPDPATIDYAHRLHAELPEALVAAAHSQRLEVPLLLALVIEQEPSTAERQLAVVRQVLGTEYARAVQKLRPAVAELAPVQCTALMEIAVATARGRRPGELRHLRQLLSQLLDIDGEGGFFALGLSKLIDRAVARRAGERRRTPSRVDLYGARQHIAVLLAALARYGHPDDAAARRAYQRGIAHILPRHWPERPALDRDWRQRTAVALDVLRGLIPMDQRLLIEGVATTIEHDGRVSVAEAEALRVICACLEVPLPPLLDGEQGADAGHATAGA